MKESLVHSQGQMLIRNWSNRVWMYLAGSFVFGLLTAAALFAVKFWFFFEPAEKFYYADYLFARCAVFLSIFPKSNGRYLLAAEDVTDKDGKNVGTILERWDFKEVTFDWDSRRWVIGYDPEKFKKGVGVQVLEGRHDLVLGLFRDYVFDHKTHYDLWFWPGAGGMGMGLLGFLLVVGLDYRVYQERRKGKILRGVMPVTAESFNRKVEGDGLGILLVNAWSPEDLVCRTFKEKFGFFKKDGELWLRIRKMDEPQHLKICGDTGVGKSQLIAQLLKQLEEMGIPAVVYDPDGIQLKHFYRPERGDVVLNPFDRRCPFWSILAELEKRGDVRAVAESLFPGEETSSEQSKWFIERTRDLFCEIIKHKPDTQELIRIMSDALWIDYLVQGTPLEQVLDKKAGPQRGGVLGTLAGLARVLEYLPKSGERKWSALEWAKKRKGWIFLTSTTSDREAVIPLQSVWLDCLIMRCMSNQEWAAKHPVAFVVDELQTLKRLPKLERGLTEMRKYGGIWIIGYQGESQLRARYGEKIVTMLSQAKTKIVMRTSEAEAAEKLSRTIGEYEVEREKISTTEGVQDARDSTNLSEDKRWERAVPATIIQNLPDLEGYLKLESWLVRFKVTYKKYQKRHPGFLELEEEEKSQPMIPEGIQVIQPVEQPLGNGTPAGAVPVLEEETAGREACPVEPPGWFPEKNDAEAAEYEYLPEGMDQERFRGY